MRQADAFDSTFHHRNLAKILDRALRMAEMAGQEPDYVGRDQLLREAMLCWEQHSACGNGPALHRGPDHEHDNGNAMAPVGHCHRACHRLQARNHRRAGGAALVASRLSYGGCRDVLRRLWPQIHGPMPQ
jgi:hypothetical protein